MGIRKLVQRMTMTSATEKYMDKHKEEYVFIDDEKVEQLHNCFLFMLKDMNAFFEKHGIKYCLIGGSLLGKVRHDGFIPWDDDFDIAMSHKDYYKLMKAFETDDCDFCKDYDLRGPGYVKGAEVRVAKIYKNDSVWEPVTQKANAMNKIFIDIFVIDYVPENKIKMWFKGLRSDFLIGVIGCVETKENIKIEDDMNLGLLWKIQYKFRVVAGKMFLLFGSLQEWYNKFDRATRYKKKTSRCTIPTGKIFYFGEIVPSEYFFPFKKTDFCGVESWVPNMPEAYLNNRYGNWQKVPKEGDREIHFVRKLEIGKIEN